MLELDLECSECGGELDGDMAVRKGEDEDGEYFEAYYEVRPCKGCIQRMTQGNAGDKPHG